MILTLIIAAGIFALCAALRKKLTGAAARPLTGWAVLDPIYNRAAAFGLKLRGTPLHLLSAAAMGVLLWAGAVREVLPRVGAGLALGGGLSNLYERLRRGKVLDYARFPHLPGRGKNYVYNAADLAIFAGLLLLLLGEGRRGK